MPYQSIGFDLLYTDGKSISVNKDKGKYIFISDGLIYPGQYLRTMKIKIFG